MKLEVVRAFAKAPITDQVTAVQVVDHMRFDRLATRDPRRWAAVVAEELRTAGMPTHLIDGTSPEATSLFRVATAKARLASASAQVAAARAEIAAYEDTGELCGGLLAEAVWAGHADGAATAVMDGRRYRYHPYDGLRVLADCPTNSARDHYATPASIEHLTRLLNNPADPGWICELGYCPLTPNEPATLNTHDPDLDAALQELADVLDGAPVSTAEQP